jgi:hypothetical protein
MYSFRFKANLNKLIASLMVAGLFATAFFVTSPSARAATGTVNLTGGTVIASAANLTFAPTTINGVDGTSTTGTLSLTVDDETALHNGWTIQASMGLLTHSNGDTLPAAFVAPGATVGVTDNTGITPTFTEPFASEYTFSSTGSDFLTANVNSGEGSHVLTVAVNQDLPASAYAGSYTATLEVTAVSGPAN